MRNRIGPKTDPYGTPDGPEYGMRFPFLVLHNVRPKTALIQFWVCAVTPYWCNLFMMYMIWQTLSNTFNTKSNGLSVTLSIDFTSDNKILAVAD